MIKKVRDLCASFPRTKKTPSGLDMVAEAVFSQDDSSSFVQSREPPERLYGIDIDRGQVTAPNPCFPGFSEYGPNERYLINKVFWGKSPLLYLVGGIGAGKTRFLHFLVREVWPTMKHDGDWPSRNCPWIVYIDFNDEIAPLLSDAKSDVSNDVLVKILCMRVRAKLADIITSVDEEVCEVWEHLLGARRSSAPNIVNNAVEYIALQVRDQDAGTSALQKDLDEVLRRRRAIRDRLLSRPDLEPAYVAALLRYVREKHFRGHERCFLLIVDNVDIAPELVQHSIRSVLQPFVLKAQVKTIVAARQTTFYQQFDESISVPAESAPYCGASPLHVVSARLAAVRARPQGFCEGVAANVIPRVVTAVESLSILLSQGLLKEFFQDICGRSVRHGLLLAQRLLDNSVFDVAGEGRLELTGSDVQRALLCGREGTFIWSRESYLENVFEVNEFPAGSYLVKLRILRMADTKAEGERLGRMTDVLQAFGYSLDLLCTALNELMLKTKRLLWNDCVQEFSTAKDLLTHRRSAVSISSRGQGYCRQLFRMIGYIQEVMLDTSGESERLGTNWDYSERDHRLSLVQKFIRLLFDEDCREVAIFHSTLGATEYARVSPGCQLLSEEILRGVKGDVERILGNEESQFAIDHKKVYEDLLIRAENYAAELARAAKILRQ